MEILDSEGRLFGRLNIIDALVVLLVVAVLGAGVALVVGPSDQGTTGSTLESDYVTVTIGPLSDDAAARLAAVDTLTVAGTETTLNVTDSVRTPSPTRDAAFAVVRARVPDDGTTARLNRSLALTIGQFTYNGTVTSLDTESTIERQRTAAVLRTAVSEQVAGTIARGDTYRLGNETVATITDVQRLGTQNGQRRLLVALDLSAHRLSGSTRFANRPLTLDTTLPFRTSSYGFTGTVVAQGDNDISTQNATVRAATTVSPTIAASVDAGDTYALDDETVATVQTVNVSPVVNSTERRLTLTMRLQTVSLEGGQRFLGSPVRVGSSIPFETQTYRFDATISNTSDTSPGRPVAATMRVEWKNVQPALADAVETGMAERHRGATTTITDVTREPATVILRSDSGEIFARDHPVNEDVTLTLSITARQTDGTLSFHGKPVQSGDRVALDFGSVTVDGTVVGLATDE